MYKIILLLLVLSSSPAAADCWRVGELRGYGVREGDGYMLGTDAYSGQTFDLNINQGIASVSSTIYPSGNPQVKCHATSQLSLACFDGTYPKETIETWQVDEARAKVIHTKAIAGRGILDGANLFVGRVVGKCI